jgi:uncharacterized protein (DUF2062 family)
MSYNLIQKIRQRILIPLRIIPKHGMSDEKLSLSITIGIVSGIFPVIGGTTAVGFLLLAAMRQNLATVQAINWIIAPIQLLSIIPFMRFGSWLLQRDTIHVTLNQIVNAFNPGLWSGLKTLGMLHIYAVLGWIVVGLPIGFVLYYLLLALFQLISKRKYQKSIRGSKNQ